MPFAGVIDKTLNGLYQVKLKTEDKMETVSLYIQNMGVLLSGTMSHVIMSDARKALHAKGTGKDVN